MFVSNRLSLWEKATLMLPHATDESMFISDCIKQKLCNHVQHDVSMPFMHSDPTLYNSTETHSPLLPKLILTDAIQIFNLVCLVLTRCVSELHHKWSSIIKGTTKDSDKDHYCITTCWTQNHSTTMMTGIIPERHTWYKILNTYYD